jgi:hypothetical protein
MRTTLILASLAISALTSTFSLAEELSVPASAQKLSSAEIQAIYDNKTHEFRNIAGKEPTTGVFTYVYKTKKVSGTWSNSGGSGDWKATFNLKKDQICIKLENEPRTCFYLFRDGSTVYEVNVKTNKVWSKNTLTS